MIVKVAKNGSVPFQLGFVQPKFVALPLPLYVPRMSGTMGTIWYASHAITCVTPHPDAHAARLLSYVRRVVTRPADVDPTHNATLFTGFSRTCFLLPNLHLSSESHAFSNQPSARKPPR